MKHNKTCTCTYCKEIERMFSAIRAPHERDMIKEIKELFK